MYRILVTVIPLLLAASICTADPSPGGNAVARAQFTTAIEDQEPVDNLSELNGSIERIFCFTEFKNLAGQIVTHSWEYKGEVVSESQFHVDGPRSRVWSSKVLTPDRPGSWTVVIMAENGKILAEKTLDYNLEEPVF